MLDFGVTFLPDPPVQTFVDRIVRAEELGFRYAWTYDSHILWEEGYILLTLAAAATSRIKLGHCVTNPGIRDPTVTAGPLRDAARRQQRTDGARHRPRRLVAPRRRPRPSSGRPVRGGAGDDQGR